MSMVLTRSPLFTIGMNGGGIPHRRSARLSQEGPGENEPPAKRAKVSSSASNTINAKEQNGDNNSGKAAGNRDKRVYDKEVEGFTFSKGKRNKGKAPKQTALKNTAEGDLVAQRSLPHGLAKPSAAQPSAIEPTTTDSVPKTGQKKSRKRLPATPEKNSQKPVRRSKRLSHEQGGEIPLDDARQASPHEASRAKSHAHANPDPSPSPEGLRPVTVEKKRKRGVNGLDEEEKVMKIALPFADTPIIRRNKEMRKCSAEGHRRSSSGMRGRRASSLMGEGRGHALPHTEVPTSEFFKHISADLTEPRRMRCLLGWCGARALPSRPEPPKENTPAALFDFQAHQAARIIQEEISQEVVTQGSLSDWFSRDECEPAQVPLKTKPNPRNIANAAKAEELERELDRLKKEREEWDELIRSATAASVETEPAQLEAGQVSPMRPELLASPQRSILERLQPTSDTPVAVPAEIQGRIARIADELEFAVDRFAHGVHALSTTRLTAERVAEKSLTGVASALEEGEKQRIANGQAADQMDVLRGLARLLNSQDGV